MTKRTPLHPTVALMHECLCAVERFTLACAITMLCIGASVLSSCSSVDSGNRYIAAPTANVPSGFPDALATTSAQDEPETITRWKPYVNRVFGYSVEIPAELSTNTVPAPPTQQHGVTINLSSGSPQAQSTAYLSVEGNFNALDWSSLDEAINQNIEWARKKASELQVLRREATRLHDLPATHVTLKYRSQSSGRIVIEDLVLAIREVEGEVGIVYTISLTTPEVSYDRGKEVFEHVVQSWRSRRPFK